MTQYFQLSDYGFALHKRSFVILTSFLYCLIVLNCIVFLCCHCSDVYLSNCRIYIKGYLLTYLFTYGSRGSAHAHCDLLLHTLPRPVRLDPKWPNSAWYHVGETRVSRGSDTTTIPGGGAQRLQKVGLLHSPTRYNKQQPDFACDQII